MRKYRYDPDWEDKRRKSSLWYVYEKYTEGKITYDEYMGILEDNYDIIESNQRQEVDNWKKKKEEEIAKKKREKFLRKMEYQKETEKAAVYFFAIVVLVVIAYHLFFRKH